MTNWKKAKAAKSEKTQPTHIAKIRLGNGEGAKYERIGAGWVDEESGAVFVKLYGAQIVSEPFTLYPREE